VARYIVVGASERIQDGGTPTQPSACKPRLGCWNWRCRKCVRPRNRFGPTLVERMGARAPDLEGLIRGMYVRGLSTRVREPDRYGEAFVAGAYAITAFRNLTEL
jgi:hypothetical protein